jgi:uncharacterized protein YcnI
MRTLVSLSLSGALLALATPALAHVSLASGPAQVAKTQKITFGVGHGCELQDGTHLDTVSIKVEIPAGISSVRPMPGDFGKATVEKSGDAVTAVVWTKPAPDAGDVEYYELTLRARVDAPAFTTLAFKVTQTCKNSDGSDVVVRWDGAAGGNPAASLVVVPARVPGWNKITLDANTTVTAANLPVYLGDAVIVWRGKEGFSANANTMSLIQGTSGASVLSTDLKPNDELWVKY